MLFCRVRRLETEFLRNLGPSRRHTVLGDALLDEFQNLTLARREITHCAFLTRIRDTVYIYNMVPVSIRGAPAVQLTERAFVRPFVIERRPPVGSADLPSRRSIYSAAMSNTYPLVARPNAVGFTLLELLTAIAVLGVLLAIGVPAFTETIRTNRLAAQANDVVQALSMARSEA